MRILKKTLLPTTMALIFTLTLPTPIQAMTYRDVPTTHFAYEAIDWISDAANGSIMVGDASNYFNPSVTVNRFDMVDILAYAAGYRYTNISPSEQELFDRAYETYKATLDDFGRQYPARWDKKRDRTAAYLLYKNILTVNEVSQFITLSNNGTETVTPLTKQESIAYMVRMDGKQSNADAISLPYHSPYKDDYLIKTDYKPYIYYAKEAGIAIGSDNFISPTREVTRAELAQMFYNMLANRTVPTDTSAAASTNVTITGTLSMDAQAAGQSYYVYITANSQTKAYPFSNTAVIMVDGTQRTAAFLLKGMTVTAITNASGQIISIVARTPAEEPAATPQPTVSLSEDEGYVTAVTDSTITIKTQRLKLTGEIVSDEKVYTAASGCKVTRGDQSVSFSDIKVNDIVLFRFNAATVYEISLQEKNRTIVGILLEKKYVDATATPVLVIEDDKNVKYELRVTKDTYFQRNRSRNVSWTDLRIGDDVEVTCEYDQLLDVYASGYRSTVTGTLEEIHITLNSQQIALRESDRALITYNISEDSVDIYELRAGMGLKLYLDSYEVYEIEINSDPLTASLYLVGTIQRLSSGNTLVVEDAGGNTYAVKINETTLDKSTGKTLEFNKLKINMSLYIELTSATSGIAKAITFLD